MEVNIFKTGNALDTFKQIKAAEIAQVYLEKILAMSSWGNFKESPHSSSLPHVSTPSETPAEKITRPTYEQAAATLKR